MHSLKKN